MINLWQSENIAYVKDVREEDRKSKTIKSVHSVLMNVPTNTTDCYTENEKEKGTS